jgi:hypothetical protein
MGLGRPYETVVAAGMTESRHITSYCTGAVIYFEATGVALDVLRRIRKLSMSGNHREGMNAAPAETATAPYSIPSRPPTALQPPTAPDR